MVVHGSLPSYYYYFDVDANILVAPERNGNTHTPDTLEQLLFCFAEPFVLANFLHPCCFHSSRCMYVCGWRVYGYVCV